MTGWDLKDNSKYGKTSTRSGDYAAQMVFVPEYHEDEVAEGGDGNVSILGSTLALNSGADGSGMDSVLDILFAHNNIGPLFDTFKINQRCLSGQNVIDLFVKNNISGAARCTTATGFIDKKLDKVLHDFKYVTRLIKHHHGASCGKLVKTEF